MSHPPPILTTLCYVRNQGKTLMLHRVKKANDVSWGKWNGLGGKFMAGESPEECVIREVKEESGLDLKNPVLRGVMTYPEFMGGRDEYVFLYTATEFAGGLIDSPEGQLEWIEDSKLTDLSLWEGDRIFFKWLDQDAFFSGKFLYRKGKCISYSVVFYDKTRTWSEGGHLLK